jgi:glycine oxidase
MAHPDVLIIGGGIVGLTTAYALAKAGVRVTVVDRGELGKEASWAGAGIIPPVASKPDDSLEAFRAFSVCRFPALSEELNRLTGIGNEFHACGGVEILPVADIDSPAAWDRIGVPYERSEWPGLNVPRGHVVYRLDYAQVRNPRHLAALVEACRKTGVTLKPNERINPSNLPAAGKYLIAAGAWADELLKPFGLPPLVHPVRGQIVLFKPDRPVLSQVVIVDHRYLVPRRDGRVLVGSTEEPEAGFEKVNTPEGVNGLIRFARSLVPALESAEVETTWAGLRPGSRDGLPYLGPVPGTPNVFAAVGHFRAGVQLSPGTGEVLAAMLTGRPPPVPVDAFRLDRPPAPARAAPFRA